MCSEAAGLWSFYTPAATTARGRPSFRVWLEARSFASFADRAEAAKLQFLANNPGDCMTFLYLIWEKK
ncbi:hypothetical protein E2320_011186 [Naja naja]|nr:hypothetical protein E2320_011186 [Naja naja]